jgi:thiol-disulfide isomerase/thioredoxin
VASGEEFRIADLAGRPIVIETMAIWCTNCFAQQQHVYEALDELGAGAIEYLLVDVDPSETAEALAAYRDRHGFTGRYVVADQVLARALAAEFGDQVLNPPATPMILIGSDGRVTLTPYGQPKSPDEIVALAREHGA